MAQDLTTEILSNSPEYTIRVAQAIGEKLVGGETLELVSDLGGGKTTFVRGLAEGFGSHDPVQSPTFTINRVYKNPDGLAIYHFDFHRLEDPGIMANELTELVGQPHVVIVIEWSELVKDVLPAERLIVRFEITGESSRSLAFHAIGPAHTRLLEDLTI